MKNPLSQPPASPNPQNVLETRTLNFSQAVQNTQNQPNMTKKFKRVEISSLDKLSFETFIYTDMSLFNAEVSRVEKKVFSSEEYIIELSISHIPIFTVSKIFDEFKTFYSALKLRFPNVNWPEFPSAFQLIGKTETRKKTFNDILERICEIARTEDKYKKSILSIFYAFFLESEISQKLKDKAQKDKIKLGASKSFLVPSIPEKKEIINSEPSYPELNSSFSPKDPCGYRKGLSIDLSKSLSGENMLIGPKSVTNDKKDSKNAFSFSESQQNLRESFTKRHSLVLSPSMQRDLGTPKKCPSTSSSFLKKERSKSQDSMKSWKSGAKSTPNRSVNKSFIGQPISPFSESDKRSQQDEEYANSLRNLDQDSQALAVKRKRKRIYSEDITTASQSILENCEATPVAKKSSFRPKGKTVISKTNEEKVVRFQESKQNKQKEDNKLSEQVPQETKALKKNSSEGENPNNRKDSKEITDSPRKKSLLVKENTENITKQEKVNEEKNLVAKRKDSRSESDHETQEIPGFSGVIYAKLSTESQWNKYFGRISDCMLLLYESILDHYPLHIIPSYHSVVEYITRPNTEWIEIYHYYDDEKMQLTIDPSSPEQNGDLNPAKNLVIWYSQLKIATQKVTGLNITHSNYQPIGKLQIIVNFARHVKGLPKNSTCFVRITHTPYTLQTSKSLMGDIIKWKQSFFIPICDTFFPITLELVCSYNSGWVKETLTEEVICSAEIVVPDALSLRSNTVLTMDMAFKYTEQKRKQVLKSLNINDQDLQDPKIRIKVKNLSTVKTYFAPPYGDYVEGVKMDAEKFQRQLLKLGLSRIKRVISFIILCFQGLDDIYHFKYPLFSTFWFLIFTWIIITSEVSNLFADFLFGLALLCIYKHPKIEAKVKPIFDKIFFQEQDVNPNYKPCVIQTLGDLTIKKNLRTAHWKYKLKDEDSLMTQLQKAKKSIVILTLVLNKISGFCEKMKNIILWDDPHRSAMFLLLTIIGYCVFSVVPIRFAILFSIWARFIGGLGHYKRLYAHNKKVALETFNFILQKNFPEHQKIITERMNMSWPFTLNFNNFQKKMVEQIKERLEVCFPNDNMNNIATPDELIAALASCYKPLKFKKDAIEEASANMFKPEEPKFTPMSILHFIMNVPSDYYRVIHPKIKVISQKIETSF